MRAGGSGTWALRCGFTEQWGICGLRKKFTYFQRFCNCCPNSHLRGSVVVVVGNLLLIPDVMTDPSAEARQWLIWALVTGLGVACARSGAWLSLLGVVLLALANSQALDPGGCSYITIMVALISQACFMQAGWLAHDYIHGVDTFASRMRFMGPLCAGMSPLWWSGKHNKLFKLQLTSQVFMAR